MENGWIQTYTGKKFSPLSPEQGDICIEDIAHALAMMCRFGGHTKAYYSVAQHSVMVSALCWKLAPQGQEVIESFWGLLHDAAEAYLVNLPRPVKHALRKNGNQSDFDLCEYRLEMAIRHKFGIPDSDFATVKRADEILLVTEARDLMAPLHPDWRHTEANGFTALPERITPWSPGKAEQEFLWRFQWLQTRATLSLPTA